ncbi:DUF6966 domain-containing protein [Pseudomonas syringae]|uniref:DUF6966 domain-containing protein n=1 Tax=Pseudomonas syringae TaxID=317 RepID=UPI0009AC39C8|nr:hypothetical protein [Pseudomonas syringae]MCF8985705.1 hypothetical protein [Pseudomonas syringae]MCF9003975.1 hypothetical protein [Pseudomonas syringae]POP75147.1 hypothetical protein CXB38_26445 [Pseudomonas syringae]
MKNLKEIILLVEKLSSLLRQYNRGEWADQLEECAGLIFDDTDYALHKIISLYGGAGSISDIILYGNGKVLFEENNILHELLSKLYSLCSGAN